MKTYLLVLLCLLGFHAASAQSPSVSTSAATNITTTSATANVSVNPNGLATTANLEWGLTTSYGNVVSLTLSPNDGTTALNLSRTLTGLSANTAYHYRVVATNSGGTSPSADRTFTTPPRPLAPTITAISSTNISNTGFTASCSINANGTPTTGSVLWGTTTSYGNTVSFALTPNNGTTPVTILRAITGLSPGTTYHYRIFADNAGGSSSTTDQVVTTTRLPTVTLTSVNPIAPTSARVNFSVNPTGLASTASFEWGVGSYANIQPITLSPNNGSVAQSFSLHLSDLASESTIMYRVVAANSSGSTTQTGTFFTFGAPIVTTGNASAYYISGSVTEAYLFLGTVTPSSQLGGKYRFEYWVAGSSTIESVSGSWWHGDTVIDHLVYGLQSNQTYQYRLVATESGSPEASGMVKSFTTPAMAPIVTSAPPTNVTSNSATAHVTVNPNGNSGTTATLWYGVGGSYTALPLTLTPATGTTAQSFAIPLTGVAPTWGSSYRYWVVATNAIGSATSSHQEFYVPFPPLSVATHHVQPVYSSPGSVSGYLLGGTVTTDFHPSGNARWEYWQDGSTSVQSVPSGWSTRFPTQTTTLTGLTPGKLYHVRFIASSDILFEEFSGTTIDFVTQWSASAWKQQQLANANASDTSDDDHDGVPLLLEYALGLNPSSSDAHSLPQTFLASNTGGPCLCMVWVRDPARADITVRVLAANTLSGPWLPIATSTRGGVPTGTATITQTPRSDGRIDVHVLDGTPAGAAVTRFLKLEVTNVGLY